ncbi:conserved membrane hypothetical protein [Flavobacterium sp. 9AF]|uniref:DUF1097 domain-containing protein n=1 Tax=Flavobacterium sp. 9AF TaxID=2653142 RepID=UPI0012EF79A1|nr:DUF1097 domain-containing protein [Flavobacterium sp. 9AF]VXA91875.1 conserved membrane hypothetical protein [Flavobacterium sp. 9AF]
MKQFLTAIIMGACGALAVFVSFSLQWPTWVLFIAWVSYYLFGKSIQSAVLALIPITAGIAMGILIQLLGKTLGGYLGSAGFPLSIFLLIGALAYLSKIKFLNNIPAWFIGLIIFFGVHPSIEFKPIFSLFIPIIAGICFAYINDSALNLLSKKQH